MLLVGLNLTVARQTRLLAGVLSSAAKPRDKSPDVR